MRLALSIKLFSIFLAFSLLVVGMAMAFSCSNCMPGDVNCPYVDIMNTGSVNGFLGVNLDSSVTNIGNVTNTTTSVQDIFGRGNLSFILKRNITSDGNYGNLGVVIGGSRVLVSDGAYASGCALGEGCNETYCDQLSSKITADLSKGYFTSTSNITPIDAVGGIVHNSYVQGDGAVYAGSTFKSLSGVNCTISQDVLIQERVKMLGTDIVYGREVSLISKH